MSGGIDLSLRIGQRVRHQDYKGQRVTGVIRTIDIDAERGLMVTINLDAPIVIPATEKFREIPIYTQHAPAHEFSPFDERDEVLAALVEAITLQSKAMERICLGGEDPSDVVDDGLIATVNAALAKADGVSA